MARRLFLLFLLVGMTAPSLADAARIKDIGRWRGVQSNHLVGVGLVVGLQGTGDGGEAIKKFVRNMDQAEVGEVAVSDFKAKNAAIVTVTAKLPPFSRAGSNIDVTVAAQNDARSLSGGVLVATKLWDTSHHTVWAEAQGSLVLGGFSAGANGSSTQKNHTTTARVPAGAKIVKTNAPDFENRTEMTFALDRVDFATAVSLAHVVNAELLGDFARAIDSRTVDIVVPPQYLGRVPEMVARLESLQVVTDSVAKVVLNERTGTVVMGSQVHIATVAIAHGGLTIQVDTEIGVSQPGAFSGGQTASVSQSSVRATEEGGALTVVGGVSIGEVVGALNQLGVSPRDLISILQAIHQAGAMDAELEVL
jgi:flagellar P-ring protein FlgI